MDKKVAELLNAQVNAEFYSAYLYLDFANFYDDEAMDGFKKWFTVQAQEELDHALQMIDFLQTCGEKVTLEAIAKPDKVLKDLVDPLEYSLEHERLVTSMIHNIYDAAAEARDYGSMQFLDGFVKEQIEEEDNAETNLKRFKRFGTVGKALFALDSELGEREASSQDE